MHVIEGKQRGFPILQYILVYKESIEIVLINWGTLFVYWHHTHFQSQVFILRNAYLNCEKKVQSHLYISNCIVIIFSYQFIAI